MVERESADSGVAVSEPKSLGFGATPTSSAALRNSEISSGKGGRLVSKSKLRDEPHVQVESSPAVSSSFASNGRKYGGGIPGARK